MGGFLVLSAMILGFCGRFFGFEVSAFLFFHHLIGLGLGLAFAANDMRGAAALAMTMRFISAP